MKILIFSFLTIFLVSCASTDDKTTEEKEKKKNKINRPFDHHDRMIDRHERFESSRYR